MSIIPIYATSFFVALFAIQSGRPIMAAMPELMLTPKEKRRLKQRGACTVRVGRAQTNNAKEFNFDIEMNIDGIIREINIHAHRVGCVGNGKLEYKLTAHSKAPA